MKVQAIKMQEKISKPIIKASQIKQKFKEYFLAGGFFHLFFSLQVLLSGIFFLAYALQAELSDESIEAKKPDRRVLSLSFVSKIEELAESEIGTQEIADKSESGKNSAKTGELTLDVMQVYLSDIRERVERNKRYPRREKILGRSGLVNIRFVLNRQGDVESLRIIKRSQYKGLNQAAVRSIRRAQPFPPFPSILPQKQLTLEYALNFRLKD